ncbi:TonB [Fulvivirga imtechensis AK7]|uniref:TonB n=1 Tax=Fulvivirga imtechensis AK7 TaxID=1237149 RepID=L8JX38_9BACT|nr:energy transducer TonB [Fulvivirga imtechensis]ELR73646.1 TonB [Fulvivirga imtechensis AK7]
MEKRKNPEKDLRKQSGLFFQIGLLAAMMLAVSAFEYRAVKIEPTVDDLDGSGIDELPIIPITFPDPPPKPPKPILAKPVEVPNDEELEEEPDLQVDPQIWEDFEPEIEPEPLPEEKAPEFHDYVEQMPSPDGGYEAFYKFIGKNMKYPSKARKLGIEGKVFVQFIIDENGKITDVKTIKGAGAGLDEEAERVLSAAPNWIPGRQGGRKVKVRMVIPITFQLNN